MVQQNNIPLGAGIILLRDAPDEESGFEILSLVINEEYDIPKGGIDPGETAFEAAVRETHEEAGISDLDFRWGMCSFEYGQLTFFVATTTQEPVISANPHTGIVEHDYALWTTRDNFINKTKKYLIPGVIWGYKISQGKL
jgi:bis(5'-nucleosidyl)-tetraphosphatase